MAWRTALYGVGIAALARPAVAQVVLSTEFDTGLTASGWTVVNARPGSPVAWADRAASFERNYASSRPGDQSECPTANSDHFGQGSQPDGYDTWLVSPEFSLAGAMFASVSYDLNYQELGGSDDHLDLDASLDCGATWTTVATHANDVGVAFTDNSGRRLAADLSPLSGEPAVVLRFRYWNPGPDTWDWYAQVDNVEVAITAAPPNVLAEERFDSGLAASGFTLFNAAPTSAVVWADMADSIDTNYASTMAADQSNAPTANSDFRGALASPDGFDAWLVSPAWNLAGVADPVLRYDVNFQNLEGGGDVLEVGVSSDGGATWDTLRVIASDVGGLFGDNTGERTRDDLSAYAGGVVLVRFRYRDPTPGAWEWYAQVDNVALEGTIDGCGCVCDYDTSTGPGVCDFFDFISFQDLFDAGDPCGCDLDTSTGPGVCDFFDFISFQDAFSAGC